MIPEPGQFALVVALALAAVQAVLPSARSFKGKSPATPTSPSPTSCSQAREQELRLAPARDRCSPLAEKVADAIDVNRARDQRKGKSPCISDRRGSAPPNGLATAVRAHARARSGIKFPIFRSELLSSHPANRCRSPSRRP